jgi:hypothetical protein
LTPEFRPPADLTILGQGPGWCREPDREILCQAGGKLASPTNSSMWATYETALVAWRKLPKCWLGVEFVAVKESHLTGTDLDDSLDVNGNVKGRASCIGEPFADSYCGIPPSGKRLEIRCCGNLRSSICKVLIEAGNDAEFYGRSYAAASSHRALSYSDSSKSWSSRSLLLPFWWQLCFAGEDLTDDQLADELACRVMGWR